MLVCGLGNPGSCYSCTRHNLGFLLLDYISYSFNLGSFSKKFSGSFLKFSQNKKDLIFFKPESFMNNSGKPISELVKFYKLKICDIIVVHDDVDLDFLAIKIKRRGSSGGHNGLKSIDTLIGKDYWRLRFGVGRSERANLSSYVLSKFSAEELKKIKIAFDFIGKNFIDLLDNIEAKIPKFIEYYKNHLYKSI